MTLKQGTRGLGSLLTVRSEPGRLRYGRKTGDRKLDLYGYEAIRIATQVSGDTSMNEGGCGTNTGFDGQAQPVSATPR